MHDDNPPFRLDMGGEEPDLQSFERVGTSGLDATGVGSRYHQA